MSIDASDRGRFRVPSAARSGATGSRIGAWIVRFVLLIALGWLVAIAVSSVTGPDREAPGKPAPDVEQPNGTRPALRAETVVLIPRAAPPRG